MTRPRLLVRCLVRWSLFPSDHSSREVSKLCSGARTGGAIATMRCLGDFAGFVSTLEQFAWDLGLGGVQEESAFGGKNHWPRALGLSGGMQPRSGDRETSRRHR